MQPMPHGYSNTVTGDGRVILKEYVGFDRAVRRDTEVEALTRLDGSGLPVPRVLSRDGDTVTLGWLPGVHGQDLIARGHAGPVLRSCGALLRSLPFTHGDYGPQNMLFDPETYAVTGVLDWEWSRPGVSPLDLVWVEWIIRTHHQDDVPALDGYFEADGERPPLATRLAVVRDRVRMFRDRPGAHPRWTDRYGALDEWRD